MARLVKGSGPGFANRLPLNCTGTLSLRGKTRGRRPNHFAQVFIAFRADFAERLQGFWRADRRKPDGSLLPVFPDELFAALVNIGFLVRLLATRSCSSVRPIWGSCLKKA